MPNKVELEAQLDFLSSRNAELEQELAQERAKKAHVKVNPNFIKLVIRMEQGPQSLQDLADYFAQDTRNISQWIFNLKRRFGANIITLSDGRKQLVSNPFPASLLSIGTDND